MTGPSTHAMRRPALWAIALALMVSAGPAVHARQGAATARERALALDSRNDTTAALAALDAGLKAAPADAGLLAAKGRIYWRLLRTASAEQALARGREVAGLRCRGAVLARAHLFLQGLAGGERVSRMARGGGVSSARARRFYRRS